MASDIVLELDTILGESQTDPFKDKGIDVGSVTFGMSNSTSMDFGGGAGTGKVHFQDFHFTKSTDSSSHALMMACATGAHLKDAKIHFRKQGGKQEEYLLIKLETVFITNYSASSGGDGTVHESFSIKGAKINYEYKKQDDKGKLGGAKIFAYDLKAGK